MVTGTGWTYDYVEEWMTLPRFYDLVKYWKKNPPTHLAVRNLGGGSREGPKRMGNLDELARQFEGAGGLIT